MKSELGSVIGGVVILLFVFGTGIALAMTNDDTYAYIFIGVYVMSVISYIISLFVKKSKI